MSKYLLLFLMLINVQIPLLKAADYNDCTQTWYIAGIGGVNFFSTNPSFCSKINTNPGFIVGGSLGYKTPFKLRIEGEAIFRQNKCNQAVQFYSHDYSRVNVKAQTYSLLVNILYDFKISNRLTHYLGVGYGFSYHELIGKSCSNLFYLGGEFKSTQWSFTTLQAIAGISLPLSKIIELGLQGRYLYNFNDTKEGCVNFSLKRFF